MFLEDANNRVSWPVQIATDNLTSYLFYILQQFEHEGFLIEQKPRLSASQDYYSMTRWHALVACIIGRNEGVAKMQTAERKGLGYDSKDKCTSARLRSRSVKAQDNVQESKPHIRFALADQAHCFVRRLHSKFTAKDSARAQFHAANVTAR